MTLLAMPEQPCDKMHSSRTRTFTFLMVSWVLADVVYWKTRPYLCSNQRFPGQRRVR